MLPEVHLKQPTAEEFRDRFLHYLRYTCGLELRHARPADHLVALGRAVRESIIDREILTRRTYDEVRAEDGPLPVDGVPARPADEQQPHRHRAARHRPRGHADARPQPRHHRRGGAGPRSRQRRSRPTRGLLPRLAGDPRLPGLRLRPALRLRHVSPGLRERLAGRTRRHLARGRFPVGDRAQRPQGPGPVRRTRRLDPGQEERQTPADVDRLARSVRRSLRRPGRRLRHQHRRRPCGCGMRARPPSSISTSSREGDYVQAVEERERVEAVNRVLYPADDVEAGRRLRLAQEYFLVACSVRDVMDRFRQRHGEAWELLPGQGGLPAQRHPPGA